eukprot:g54878.t1
MLYPVRVPGIAHEPSGEGETMRIDHSACSISSQKLSGFDVGSSRVVVFKMMPFLSQKPLIALVSNSPSVDSHRSPLLQ